VLLGLASNTAVKDIELNLNSNALGIAASQVLEDCLPTAVNIATLDLSDNGSFRYVDVLVRLLSYGSTGSLIFTGTF